MAAERHNAAFVVGAVVGGLAGAAGALWRAPQAGGRTRAQIAERWDEATERLAQGIADVDGRARGLLGQDEPTPDLGAVVVTETVVEADAVVGTDAAIDGLVVVDADPAPPGPRPGPIVDGTVVADLDPAAPPVSDPIGESPPPVASPSDRIGEHDQGRGSGTG